MPMPQQTMLSLQRAATDAVKTGNWTEYAGWLEGLLRAEFSRAAFQPGAEAFARLMGNPQMALALSQWRLLQVTGAENFKAVADKDGAEFLTWLLTSQPALDAYLGSGPLDKEQSGHGLEIWRDLFRADTKNRDGLWLRVAAATALAHTVPVKAMADGQEIDPVQRYQYYQNAAASGLLAPSFEKAAVWELRFVVNSWARNEDMAWVLSAMDQKNKSQEKIGEACWMVPYRLENSKGVSVQNGAEYYDHKPMTMQLMHEVGGVCGAISRFGTAAAQAYGVPAMPVGQPGHCAFLWKHEPQAWRTGNDISGWAGSTEHGGIYIHWGNRGSYVLLMEEVYQEPEKFLASERATWAATLAGPHTLPLLQTAVKLQPLNAGAWQTLTKSMESAKDVPLASWQSAARDLMQAMGNFPVPLVELLEPVEAKLEIKDDAARSRYVSAVAAAVAKGDEKAQHGCGQQALEELISRHASTMLPGGKKALAAILKEDGAEESAAADSLTDAQRAAILGLVEGAVAASRTRADLQNGLTGRYLNLMTSSPDSLARAIKFFGGLFETAKQNPDRKPAIALARRIILMAEKAEDRGAMELYSAECRKLLK